ncbi:hypothetical protein ACFSHT_39980 [Paraburkholderia silviterrae]|uniref:Uncharacterized protein n=1 Tax=Paraburkholderia silviterrae TaxID=2528715 RepID=A0A4R5M388_9BURK|nr:MULTISPECIES: hypothetical protein [Paraburkholderia]TDG19396.1 hypothetical protein EYW47_30895 [Paraburkholderia silviterrae]
MNESMVEAFLCMRDEDEDRQYIIDAAYCLDANAALPAGSTIKEQQPRSLIERGQPHWYTTTSAATRH